jgi:small subunit ribosomal protein S16
MVKLRLRRKGRTHYPIYDIVAVDSRARRDGAFIERLGYYDPHTNPSTISLNPDRALYWMGVGAQPTEIVRRLFGYNGIMIRKHLSMLGKNQVEIEGAVTQHKEKNKASYFKLKELRKIREEKKAKAEEEKKEAEAKQ